MVDNLVESSVGWMVNCSVMLAAEPRDGWMVDTTAHTTDEWTAPMRVEKKAVDLVAPMAHH